MKVKLSKSVLSVTLFAFMTTGFVSCETSEDETELEEGEPVEGAEEGADSAAAEPEAPAATAQTPPPSSAAASTPTPDDQIETVPTNEAAQAASATVPGPETRTPKLTGSATRRVMYVKSNGVKAHEQPDAKSKVVGKFDKGDHFLVDVQGAWARTPRGHFVALSSLSEKGIGRSKRSGVWRNPDGSTSKPVRQRASQAPAASAPEPSAVPTAPTTGSPDAAPTK